MLSINPILGIGYGNFSKLYMFYQKEHLSSTNNFIENNVADNTCFSFNEPLQLFIECGAISILFFLVLAICFLKRLQNSASNHYKLLLALIVVSCFFYYSLHIIIVLIIQIACFAFFSINSNQNRVITLLRNFFSVSLLFLCLCFFSRLFIELNALRNWKKAQAYYLDNESLALSLYIKANQTLCYKGNFLYNYGVALYESSDYEKAIAVFEKANKIQPHSDTYIYLGKSYENIQNYNFAEKSFLAAQQMVPSRFIPNYLLFHLYMKINDSIRANNIAVKISNMPIKIPSKEVFKIKKEVIEFLSSN